MATSTFLGTTAIVTPSAVAVRDLKHSSVRSVSVAPQAVLVRASASAEEKGRREMLKMAGAMFALGVFSVAGNARAGLVDDLLAKSLENKALNDAKRLATSGANTARAYTVTFGTCKFPENFTGCQDLAKATEVKFLSDDLKLECEGKEKYKCGSNVFWKW